MTETISHAGAPRAVHEPAGHAVPAMPRVPPALVGAAGRQRTCAACGAPLMAADRTGLEAFSDGEIRYAAVHAGHTTFAASRERAIAERLRRAA
jgi:hypothetical protein